MRCRVVMGVPDAFKQQRWGGTEPLPIFLATQHADREDQRCGKVSSAPVLRLRLCVLRTPQPETAWCQASRATLRQAERS